MSKLYSSSEQQDSDSPVCIIYQSAQSLFDLSSSADFLVRMNPGDGTNAESLLGLPYKQAKEQARVGMGGLVSPQRAEPETSAKYEASIARAGAHLRMMSLRKVLD